MAEQDGERRRPVVGRPYRTPRYSVFLLSGAGVGALAGLVLVTFVADPTAGGGPGTTGYFVVFGAFLGALLAGGVGVVVESVVNRGRRR